MSLNSERNTPYRKGELRTFVAGGTIYAGGLAALDSNGKAVAATPASGRHCAQTLKEMSSSIRTTWVAPNASSWIASMAARLNPPEPPLFLLG